MAIEQARFTTIADGLHAQVVVRSGIPAHATSASHEGQSASCPCRPLVESMRGIRAYPFVPALGPRLACRDSHDYRPWLRGLYGALELALARCVHCEAVEVRDITFDILPGISSGHARPRRRSDVLGWYSGMRSNGRIYR